MTKEPRAGFFERLTGARVMTRDDSDVTDFDEDEIDYNEQDQDVLFDDSEPDSEELSDALDEPDFSDEASLASEDYENTDAEEQEGQLTVDVFQDDENVIIQSTIAGVTPDDLDVSITNDMVTVRGERHRTYEVDAEDYFYQECYWGPFSRSIILPVEIDADRAEAKIKNGVLTLRIPKANTAVTRKLKVKAS